MAAAGGGAGVGHQLWRGQTGAGHYPVFGVLAVRFILAGLCLLPALRAIRWQTLARRPADGGILLAILLS